MNFFTSKSFVIGLIVVCLGVIGFFSVYQIDRIDSGQTGIMVNLAGSERGVDEAKVETGWVVFNRFTKELFEYPAFAQIVDYEKFEIQDKKGEIFTADPTVEYYIERDNAKTVFLRYRKNIKSLERSAILSEVKNAYKDVCGLYETDSLINNRPQFEKEVEALLSQRLKERGFTLSNIQSSVKPNEAMQSAINSKNISVQQSLKTQNELMQAKAEAEKIVADAKASVNGELTEEQKKAIEERKAYWNELVEVKLFKDNNKYKDDVFVSVNGENCVIKRGEKVKIKRKFAAVLDSSDLQDYETSLLIEKKSNEFAKSE